MEQLEYKPDYKLERWITLILALLFLIPFVARGQEPEPEASAAVTLNDIRQGTLLLTTNQPGLYLPAPSLRTAVEMRINGMILRARVVQQFQNSAEECVEGIYVFPLPEDAAVDRLHMTIGTRRIEGQIQEREQARRTYEVAKSEGRKASLLEQERPNIFTVSVASLLPEEVAEIEIEYQQVVEYRDGSFRLRFPMVVAPRYTPGTQAADRVFARVSHRIPENFLNDEELIGSNNVQLRIEMNPGMPLRDIRSTYHPVQISNYAPSKYEITLADGEVAADRDFELVWQPELGREPKAAVFSEAVGGETYGLVMVVPPAAEVTPVRLPRETIYIIDTSGSMQGASMRQAKEALLLAIQGLDPADLFNVIEFDSDVRQLFERTRAADPSNIEEAIAFVEALEADEGTEMLPAITAALGTGSTTTGRVRQVIFITDGQVSNEQELFQYLHSHLGATRLFLVGIGSAPNSHFMRRAAQIGRGTFTYIGDLAEVKTKMAELFGKLDHPVLTDVQIQFEGAVSEVWPARVPDLYVGEPVLVTMKLGSPDGQVSISGSIGSGTMKPAAITGALRSWNATLSMSSGKDEAGIGKLWARRKIESLDDSVTAGADAEQVRGEIVTTALRHHLVSQHTSLVAVDVTPTGIDAARCIPQRIALNVPRGWSGASLPGTLPATGTPAPFFLILGLVFTLLGAALWRYSS